MVSTGTQTSTDSPRLPSRSPSSGAVPVTPLSNRKVDAASSASTSGQGLTPPAPPGPLAPKGRGLPPRSSAPQRKPVYIQHRLQGSSRLSWVPQCYGSNGNQRRAEELRKQFLLRLASPAARPIALAQPGCGSPPASDPIECAAYRPPICTNQTVRTTDFFSLHVQWANLENQVPPGVDTWDNIGTVNLKHLCRNRCMKQFVIFGNFKSHIVDTWQTVSKKWSFTLKFDKVACTTKSIDRSLRSNHGTALRVQGLLSLLAVWGETGQGIDTWKQGSSQGRDEGGKNGIPGLLDEGGSVIGGQLRWRV
ncbi:hypothetical protein ISCGN_019802 [Ixodes scapularis]